MTTPPGREPAAALPLILAAVKPLKCGSRSGPAVHCVVTTEESGTISYSYKGDLVRGVTVEGQHYGPIKAELEREQGDNSWLSVALREGKNREVRRLFESQDLKVSRLIRVRYGPILLGRGVKSGGYRELDKDELNALRAAVGFEAAKKPKQVRERRSRPGAEERKIGDVPRRDAIKKIDRTAKPAGWTGYKPRKPE